MSIEIKIVIYLIIGFIVYRIVYKLFNLFYRIDMDDEPFMQFWSALIGIVWPIGIPGGLLFVLWNWLKWKFIDKLDQEGHE